MKIDIDKYEKHASRFLGKLGKKKIIDNINFSDDNKIISFTYIEHPNFKVTTTLTIAINSKIIKKYDINKNKCRFDILPSEIERKLILEMENKLSEETKDTPFIKGNNNKILRLQIDIIYESSITSLWSCTGTVYIDSLFLLEKNLKKLEQKIYNDEKTCSKDITKQYKDYFYEKMEKFHDSIENLIDEKLKPTKSEISDLFDLKNKLNDIDKKYHSQINQIKQEMTEKSEKQKEIFEQIVQYTTSAAMKDFYKTVESIKSQLMNEMKQLNTKIETIISKDNVNDHNEINEQFLFKVSEIKSEIENLNNQLSEVTTNMKNEISSVSENQMNVIKMGMDDSFRKENLGWLTD